MLLVLYLKCALKFSDFALRVFKSFGLEGIEGVIIDDEGITVGSCFSLDAFFADVIVEVGFTICVCLDFGSSEGFNKKGIGYCSNDLLGHVLLSSVCKRNEGGLGPSHKVGVLISSIIKRRKIIGDDGVNEHGLDLGVSCINPFIHFVCQQAEFIIYNCMVGRVYVLHAGHEDRLIAGFVDRELTFLKTTEANFPSLSVIGVIYVNKVVKRIREERAERRNGGSQKFEGVSFLGEKIRKGIGEGVGIMGATNTVMDMDKNLRNSGEPQLAMRGRDIGGCEETMGEDFVDTLEGYVGNGTLRSVREVGEEDGIGNDNGVGGFDAFGYSNGELAKGDGNWRFWNVRDEGLH